MLKEYITNLLPEYIATNDSYKDGDGKGFVVRFLEIFGEELDDETLTHIENYLENVIDVNLIPENLLTYLEDTQGDIFNFSFNIRQRRNVIKYISYLYSIKGTRKSIFSILAARGYVVAQVYEYPAVEYKYDSVGTSYDADGARYDTGCSGCSEIAIGIEDNPFTPWNATEQALVESLVELMLPINTILRGIFKNLDIPAELSVEPDYDEFGIAGSFADNTAGTAKFQVFRSASEFGIYTKILTLNEGITTFVDTAVIPETLYYYKIRSFIDPVVSEFGNIASAQLAGYELVALYDAINIEVDLSWNLELESSTEFELQRADTPTGPWVNVDDEIPGNQFTYTDNPY